MPLSLFKFIGGTGFPSRIVLLLVWEGYQASSTAAS
jgi:hypothetical protein